MTRRSLFALVALLAGALARTAGAHTISPQEILDHLNDAKDREKTGVVRARNDPKLPRLLLVEVGERWYGIDRATRQRLAKEWLGLWRHSVATGVVSVLDEKSGESVVKYRPDGSIEVADRKPGERR